MDRLRAMEVFIAVAEAGAFATAGARLGMSPPAVSRAISALESHLGAQLLSRTTRQVRLTEVGTVYLERARRLLEEIREVERTAAGEAAVPSGQLTMTSSVMFGRMHAVEVMSDFLREHPRITASVLLLDRVVDLVNEGVDVAIRIGALPELLDDRRADW